MGWKSIKSAPKDGTPIIIYNDDKVYSKPYRVQIAEWRTAWAVEEKPEGGWACDGIIDWLRKPTHWMPLPKPPEAV